MNFVAILVGNARSWLPELVERASQLKVSGGFEDGTDVLVTSYEGFPTITEACL